MTGYDPRAGAYIGGEDFGVAAGEPPDMNAEELDVLIRFEHPAKLLSVAELPGAAALDDAALAAAYRTDPAQLRSRRAAFRRAVRTAARELVADAGLRDAVRAIPVGAGATVVALGDSITDDALSWAELLRECFALVRPQDAVAVVNAGVSGDTTADALRRLYGVVRVRPQLVVTMLGTNDCQRHGPELARLVAAAESARNLAAIARWLVAAGARTAWITPPPVLEDALATAVGDRPFTVHDADVRAVAAAVRTLGGPVVDLHELLGAPPAPGLLMADGVHPSAAGQTAIAAGVLTALAGGSVHAAHAGSASSHIHSGTGKP
jgi:lysophospholipase L1-like esterase